MALENIPGSDVQRKSRVVEGDNGRRRTWSDQRPFPHGQWG